MAEPGRIQWHEAGKTEADFVKELLHLYWEALEGELADAILSLKWIIDIRDSNPDANIGPSDITERVPRRLGPPMWEWNPLGLDFQEIIGTCLHEAMEYAEEQQDQPDEYLLARYMLCGLGMLDIDEVVEYREALLPSHNGPPRFHARRDSKSNHIEISMSTCDICEKPLRGMAWTCRAGCKSPAGEGSIPGPFILCMPCYHSGEHQQQHLVRLPHLYAISPSLQAELSSDDFWALRREIQRKQYAVDAQQDKAEQGFLKSSLIQAIEPVSRDMFPLGNVHSSLMFGPLVFEIGLPE
jgi:hypothetical protein